ncbi:uncharacterized protein [Rutidosis leptorrhynchoides]|uniref:uncharacterized protein n=1 Tax=Rutidosis leptorrhynchoides TaxID=125765 RepID=UPI003A9A3DF6
MAIRDQDKTAFHTPDGIFCYIMMPFGLKNAGATYQRVIDKAFKDQIGKNVEAYVDDIVIKSHREDSMLRDTLEMFESLRKVNMKLNPKKCNFGVEEGKFLGYIVTERGIKANPKKIQAIENMISPKTKKEVQSLNGRLAALTRFLPRATDRSLPFMKVLKSCLNKKDFKWTEEAEKAFQDIKQLLKELPTLTAPIEGETLILYLAASAEAISSILITERKGIQMPIYFVSKVLQQSEVNYPPIEKLSSGRLAKWAIELGEYEINFSPRHAVKGQILEDFLLETTEKVDHPPNVTASNHVWELHTDGASNEEGVGAGLVFTSPEGEEHTHALRFCFYASNNEAEYEALLFGLHIASEMGIKHLRACVDSQIMAQQVNRGFEAKDVYMKQYLQLVEKISKHFNTLEVVQIPRNKNKKADVLSKLATLTFDHLHKKVLVEVLKYKSVDEKIVVATVEERESCWITPYVKYLQDGTLPTDAMEERRIRISAPLYVLENGILYRKSFSGPNLRCLTPQQAIDVV